ncbi:MAG: betaine--homocysteine S-methyltransferase [Phyllobacteriaceae bacterium]|nr:betaine--homocysteine S-methyltransferase [Phyllobacteriaceae bacterium]
MTNPLADLIAKKGILLADGATGTNLFQMGLMSGDAPELWNIEHPDRITKLHQDFVDAGADIILTNTFGGTRHRMKLHHAQDRVFEINKAAAEIARAVADKAGRTVIVAGSVGPTGELFVPLGALTHEDAVAAFAEQMEGLKAGGADVAWIETMSAPEEIRAAAEAAIKVGMPYTFTGSFDTAGKTMMGLHPRAIHGVLADLENQPIAVGANCGVGASDMLATLIDMHGAAPERKVIVKGNCGIPQFQGEKIVYSGTPELMAEYVRLAVDGGATIIGGCCGTSAHHLAAMRVALDAHKTPSAPLTLDAIVEKVGPLRNTTADEAGGGRTRERVNRRNR